MALDKTPAELRRLALRIWEGSPPVDTAFDVVFPVDAAGAASPEPLPFGAAERLPLGTASMRYGVRVRPEIVDLMAAMARHGVVPAVVSASHVDLVGPVLERYYGLGSSPLAGMRTVLEGGTYGPDLTAPATYRPGKVDAARALARSVTGREDARPVFCAGDTTTDLEMVAYSSGYRLFFDRGKRPFMDSRGLPRLPRRRADDADPGAVCRVSGAFHRLGPTHDAQAVHASLFSQRVFASATSSARRLGVFSWQSS